MIKSRTRERLRQAKKELENARNMFETKKLEGIDDKLFRYATAKKSVNYFEERYRRLSELRAKAINLGNKTKLKQIEKEMMETERDIGILEDRIIVLGGDLSRLIKKRD